MNYITIGVCVPEEYTVPVLTAYCIDDKSWSIMHQFLDPHVANFINYPAVILRDRHTHFFSTCSEKHEIMNDRGCVKYTI